MTFRDAKQLVQTVAQDDREFSQLMEALRLGREIGKREAEEKLVAVDAGFVEEDLY